MIEKLVEAKLELDRYGDVILKQLIQTDEQKPKWSDTNISDFERTPDPAEEDSMTSEDSFLAGVASLHGVEPDDLHQRLRKGETIQIYPPPYNP
jgi:hypothetical protein